MNCANCVQPIRLTGERDGIERHDGRYEYEYVHEDGNPVCPLTFVATPPGLVSPPRHTRPGSLTDADRDTIARARELAGAKDLDALREVTGTGPDTDYAMVAAGALGAAQYLLGELAAIIDRLDGDA